MTRKKIKNIVFILITIALFLIPQNIIIKYSGIESRGNLMPIEFVVNAFSINPILSFFCILLVIIEAFIISNILFWIIYKKIDEHKEKKRDEEIEKDLNNENYEWRNKKNDWN
jgi:hypothetical protein